ncbi:hypothetical protein ACFFRR_002909 [Megaselia abdita]
MERRNNYRRSGNARQPCYNCGSFSFPCPCNGNQGSTIPPINHHFVSLNTTTPEMRIQVGIGALRFYAPFSTAVHHATITGETLEKIIKTGVEIKGKVLIPMRLETSNFLLSCKLEQQLQPLILGMESLLREGFNFGTMEHYINACSPIVYNFWDHQSHNGEIRAPETVNSEQIRFTSRSANINGSRFPQRWRDNQNTQKRFTERIGGQRINTPPPSYELINRAGATHNTENIYVANTPPFSDIPQETTTVSSNDDCIFIPDTPPQKVSQNETNGTKQTTEL